MKKRVEKNQSSEEQLPAIDKSPPKEEVLPPIVKPTARKKSKEEIREEEVGMKKKEDVPMDIKEIYEAHVEESLDKRKRQRLRKNLFYTFIIFGFLGLVIAPMLATYLEFYINPEEDEVQAAWFTMPLGERIDVSIRYSLKHWYFYFIPVAFFVSTVFFTRKDGD